METGTFFTYTSAVLELAEGARSACNPNGKEWHDVVKDLPEHIANVLKWSGMPPDVAADFLRTPREPITDQTFPATLMPSDVPPQNFGPLNYYDAYGLLRGIESDDNSTLLHWLDDVREPLENGASLSTLLQNPLPKDVRVLLEVVVERVLRRPPAWYDMIRMLDNGTYRTTRLNINYDNPVSYVTAIPFNPHFCGLEEDTGVTLFGAVYPAEALRILRFLVGDENFSTKKAFVSQQDPRTPESTQSLSPEMSEPPANPEDLIRRGIAAVEHLVSFDEAVGEIDRLAQKGPPTTIFLGGLYDAVIRALLENLSMQARAVAELRIRVLCHLICKTEPRAENRVRVYHRLAEGLRYGALYRAYHHFDLLQLAAELMRLDFEEVLQCLWLSVMEKAMVAIALRYPLATIQQRDIREFLSYVRVVKDRVLSVGGVKEEPRPPSRGGLRKRKREDEVDDDDDNQKPKKRVTFPGVHNDEQ